MDELTIGEVAARAGINASRIRYYERVGVLPPAERGTGGQRRYAPATLDRLAIVDVAQRAGLTLREIRDLTGPGNRSQGGGERIRTLAESKLPEIEALIARAEAIKAWLAAAQACDCATVDVCSLFTDPTLAPPPLEPTPGARLAT